MLSDNSGKHEMVLEACHPSGAEEWYCPLCGRRLLMQWPPFYKKIVLEPGDETAVHCGGSNGANIESPDFKEQASGENPLKETQDEDRLVPFEVWMEQVDFDNLWNQY